MALLGVVLFAAPGWSWGACRWAGWTYVSGGGTTSSYPSRGGWATEVGVYKSADVCIVAFVIGRKGVGFIVFISDSDDVLGQNYREIRGRREIH